MQVQVKKKQNMVCYYTCDGVRISLYLVACASIHMHVLASAAELCMYEMSGCFESHSDTQLLAAAQPCSLAYLLSQPMTILHVMLDSCGSHTQLCFIKTGSDHNFVSC